MSYMKKPAIIIPVAASTLILMGGYALPAEIPNAAALSTTSSTHNAASAQNNIITADQARAMKGCKASTTVENGVTYLDIAPKDGAEEGVISYNLKPDEFESLQQAIKQAPRGSILRFKKKVYGYGRLRNRSVRSEGLFNKAPISGIDASNPFILDNATDLEGLFNGCYELKDIRALEKWNVSNATSFGQMFKGCISLEDISALQNWNTANVKTMAEMFHQCKKLTSIDALKQWDTTNLDAIWGMFDHCKSITNVNALENWNVSKVKFFSNLFTNCEKLSDISKLKNWDTKNVKEMDSMFTSCKELTSISALSTWKTDKVTTLKNTFAECEKLTSIDAVKDWNTEKLTTLEGTFAGCKAITSVEPLRNWNTANVTSMKETFRDCLNIPSVDALTSWNTAKVTDMEQMFSSCFKLNIGTALNGWDTTNVTNKKEMFSGVGAFDRVLDLSGTTLKGGALIEGIFAAMKSVLVLNNVNMDNVAAQDITEQNFFGNYRNHLIITNNAKLLQALPAETTTYRPDLGHDDPQIKLIYSDGTHNTTQEVTIPAIYDSRIDPQTGKLDATKEASTNLRAVVEPRIREALYKAADEIRGNVNTLAPNNELLFVPSKTIADNANPMALIQDYYVAHVKEDVQKAKMKFQADDTGTLAYQDKKLEKDAIDGTKRVVTGALKNGVWDPKATNEEIITAAQEGLTKVGNVQKTHSTLNFQTTYVAQEQFNYQEQKEITAGVNGEETVTTTYVVNPDTGLTNEKESEKGYRKAPSNQVMGVGNKEVINNADGSTTTNVYKVDPQTGKLSDPTVTTTPKPKPDPVPNPPAPGPNPPAPGPNPPAPGPNPPAPGPGPNPPAPGPGPNPPAPGPNPPAPGPGPNPQPEPVPDPNPPVTPLPRLNPLVPTLPADTEKPQQHQQTPNKPADTSEEGHAETPHQKAQTDTQNNAANTTAPNEAPNIEADAQHNAPASPNVAATTPASPNIAAATMPSLTLSAQAANANTKALPRTGDSIQHTGLALVTSAALGALAAVASVSQHKRARRNARRTRD